jgi:hypothetical protein
MLCFTFVTTTFFAFAPLAGALPLARRAMGSAWATVPTLKVSRFTTGVSAMQLTVVDYNTVSVVSRRNEPSDALL